MVWNQETCQQEFAQAAEVLPYTQLLPAVNSSIELPALPGHSENGIVLSNVMHPISTAEFPESFTEPASTQYNNITNSPECAMDNQINLNQRSQYDAVALLDSQSWPIQSNLSLVPDNATQNLNAANPEISYYQINVPQSSQIVEDIPARATRTRQDSTESLDSASTGEMFSSDYTDTISSVESTEFLLKPSTDSCEELPTTTQPLQEIYYNDVYMSCSSTEMLNDTESDEETVQNHLYQEIPIVTVTEPLLETRSEEQSSTCQISMGEERIMESQEDGAEKVDNFTPHSLIPIDENQVIRFNVEEVQPTEPFIKITNNIISVDESFLFHSSSSLWDLEAGGKNGKRAVTMQNLHERSSFQDLTETSKIGKACQKALLYIKDDINFGSLASLNNITKKQIEKESGQSLSLISGEKGVDMIKSTKHTRNLLALSVCLTLLYIAVGSVRNLQSSINHEGGVGVLSMAMTCIGYLLGSMFSASLVLSFQPRKCIIINLIPNLLYVAANIYPTIWLMIPVSLIQGLSVAIIWNAMSTYVTFLSRGRSQKKGEAVEQVSSRFFGILCLMYQSHLIIGNLIASLVLMPGGSGMANNETVPQNFSNATGMQKLNPSGEDIALSPMPSAETNVDSRLLPITTGGIVSNISSITASVCGSKFCHLSGESSGSAVSDETKYLLFGIYMGCIVIAILIAVFFLEPLNPRLFTSTVRPLQKMKCQLTSLIAFFANVKFLLLLPMLMYSVIQFAFITAEFTKAFVTCSLGIHMVGYTMICLGVCGSLSSYLSGLLIRVTGRIPLFIFAAASNLALLIYMKQWEPSADSLTPFFIIMGLWGIGDGIWISQTNSLMGIIFPQRYEDAYGGLRIAQGLGPAIAYGYSASVCMDVKIFIMISLCVVSVILYLIMESLLRGKGREKFSLSFKQTSV